MIGGCGSRPGSISSSVQSGGMSVRSALVLAMEVPLKKSFACSALFVANERSVRYNGSISDEDGGFV